MTENDWVEIVKDGYDVIARAYHYQRDRFKSDEVLDSFVSSLPPGGKVLDAGCGAGIPVMRILVDAGFKVTGVDISSSMLELARFHVPEATLLRMDMRDLSFEKHSFDGISAFYSLFHVPREEHLQVLAGFNKALRQNGILCFCTGSAAWEGVENFHGAPMYWSHPDPEVTQKLVVDAGFTILWSEVREYGDEEQYWVLARKHSGLRHDRLRPI